MEKLFLSAEKRARTGKSGVRSIRRAGKVPGVVYGIQEPTPLTVCPKELESLLGTRAGSNVVFQLRVEGEAGTERPAIVKALQRDSMRGTIMHADFLEIRMDEKIQVAIPVALVGESPGEKLGGTLSQLLREMEVECLPHAIPDELAVDVSGVGLGDVVHVRDLRLPEGVALVTDADEPVLTVLAPAEEEASEDEYLEADAPAADPGESPAASSGERPA